MVCDTVEEEDGRSGRRSGRTKKKNPTQRCGEKQQLPAPSKTAPSFVKNMIIPLKMSEAERVSSTSLFVCFHLR